MKLFCERKAEQTLVTPIGAIVFDSKGYATVEGDEQEIRYIAEAIQAVIVPANKKSKVEETPKVEEIKVEDENVEDTPKVEEIKVENTDETDYSKFSVKQLKAVLREKGIEIPKDAISKTDLIALL